MDVDRVVRFICTDEGAHPRRVLDTLGLNEKGEVQRVGKDALRSSAMRNLRSGYRDEALSSLPDFDLRCTRCPRNPRASTQKMRRIVEALLQVHKGAVVEYDVSSPSSSTLF